QLEDVGKGLAVRDLVGVVHRRAVDILGDAAEADALGNRVAFGLELLALDPRIHRRAQRVGGNDPDLRVLFFQKPGNAGKGAAGPDGAGEAVDAAFGLLPDLGAGAAVVAVAVGGVVPLVGPERPELFRHALGDVHVVVRVLVGDGGHFAQLRPAQAQHVFLFLALRIGDDDDGAVAARVADEREADAGVARGALDDHAAGLEHAAALGVEDDVERGAVLHRAAGVEELGLSEDVAAGALGGAAQADERRVADRADESVAHFHYSILIPACRTTRSQRARSVRICSVNCSGVLPTGSMPRVA